MCLVSYSPTEKGFILCSNRDESPRRSLSPLQIFENKSGNMLCPVDTKGGSWIICSADGRAICILNGAFTIHKRKPPYRISRGLMMKAYFNYETTSQFIHKFDFSNIEPFTMIIRDVKSLYEFRWDGRYRHIQHLTIDALHIWSSCTLYTPEVQEERERLYREKYKTIKANAVTIFDIQRNGNLGDEGINFVMNREDRVATISITVLEKTEGKFQLTHHDLRNGGEESRFLDIEVSSLQRTWPQ